MEIKTKYNMFDIIYYGDENAHHKGCISDINIIFLDDNPPIIRYKVDKQFDIPSRYWSKDEIRFQEFDESMIYSSPNHLIVMQIQKHEKQILSLYKRIDELRTKLEKKDNA